MVILGIWNSYILLWDRLIEIAMSHYFNNPVPDSAVIYADGVPFQYNEQEGMYTEFLGNPSGNISSN